MSKLSSQTSPNEPQYGLDLDLSGCGPLAALGIGLLAAGTLVYLTINALGNAKKAAAQEAWARAAQLDAQAGVIDARAGLMDARTAHLGTLIGGMMPYLVVFAILAILCIILIAVLRSQSKPPQILVINQLPDQQRADFWRQLEGPDRDKVIIYDAYPKQGR